MKRLTEILADAVLDFHLDALPTQAVARAQTTMKDCLGCLLAGSRETPPAILGQYARELGARPAATVLGVRGLRTDAGTAAMINGTAAHIHDYDDVSTNVTGHPSVVCLPVALALGEETGASGKAVLEAYMLGIEVMGLMGRGLNPQHYSRGWHNTGTLGTFGAAAAAGKLLGLTRQQLIYAFSIAASRAAGLKGNFGTMTKSVHAGLAASNGIFAAKTAKLGLDANPDIFEMDEGYVSVTTGSMDLDAITDFLASGKSEFLHPGLAIKPFPSCKATHNGINAAMELQQENGFRAEEVESIQVDCQPIAKDLLKYPIAQTPLQGKFSMNYCIACALLYGQVTLSQFEGTQIEDPAVLELMHRIRMDVCPDIAGGDYYNGTWETGVRITLRDGRRLEKRVRYATGDPERPLSAEALDVKFRDCLSKVADLSKAEPFLRCVEELQTLPDLTPLLRSLEDCLLPG